ncbi:hypothetical protein EBZ80_19010 [bacterium]|nr:hypothetical protein [bacterium]
MSAHLKLGDIIQFEAKNQDLNNHVYVIDYLDETKLRLIDAETMLPRTLTINADTGSFSDESIFNINILDHAPEPGYARQNGLLPNTWVDIYFGGEHPTVITGRISNLEDGEDMIELTTAPDNEVIYIDFGFKGLPEHMPIERINIRPPPSSAAPATTTDEAPVAAAASDPFDDGLAPPVQPMSVAVPAVRNAIAEMLHDADEIMASQAVQEFSFMVDVPAERKRYSIESQTNDMLNALLSNVPATQRTDAVLNGIHTLITRFKQLREQFSTFDRSGNAHVPLTHGPDHRPLIESLRKLNQRLHWILPVAACRKKTYVNEETDESLSMSSPKEDVVQMTMSQMLTDQSQLYTSYKNGGDRYAAYMNKLSTTQFTPFEPPEYEEDYLKSETVCDNMTAVIDNLGQLESSVVAGEELKTRRFVVQRYNLGLTRLQSTAMTEKRMTADVVPMTPADTLTLKSFIMLPEPTVAYSRINLHTINILDKSQLNQHNLNYWQLLRKTTRISTRTIDDLDEHIAFNSRDFLSDIKEYVLNAEITDADRYAEYLRIVVPRTRVLFDLVKKHLVGSLSLSEIVDYLEPFMVYHRDLTHRQYTDMVGFLRERIRDHKRNYALLKTQCDKVRTHNYGVIYLGMSLLHNLLVSGKAEADESGVFETYGFSKEQYNIGGDTAFQRADAADAEVRLRRALTPSELLHRMLVADNARLYMCAVAKLNLDLLTSFDFGTLLSQQTNRFKQRKAEEEGANKCANIVIAKQYLSDSDELEDDNGINIAFDRKFDRTNYEFIKRYESQQQAMPREEFILFLKEEVKRELKVPDDRQAGVEVEAMLLGERPVQDGQYAVIEMDNADGTNRYLYYVRKNKQWIRDTNIPAGVSMYDPAFFCNVQEKCFTVEQTCMDYNLAADAVKEGLLNEMNAEFKAGVDDNRERTVQRIGGKFSYYDTVLPRLRHMKYARMTKYNDAQLRHQVSADELQDIVQSPYERLKTIILGQSDLVKRNADVLDFAERYTRAANERFSEDPHWLYCVKTDVKLLPSFLRRLAAAFSTSASSASSASSTLYQSTLRTICREQGELSDEGNAIVDKHSGYVIMMLESATEEGSDFRGMLSGDDEGVGGAAAAATSVKTTVPKKYDNPRAGMISNVVTSMGNYLSVDLNPMREFIVEKTMAALNSTMVSEEQYNKMAQKKFETDKKRPPSFKEFMHTSLLFTTLAFLTVAIQTAIPSLKTNKTQPGCVRSFMGYPLLGEEDMSGIRYVACIAHQLKSKSVEPWSAVKDLKESTIADRIKTYLNKYAVVLGEISDLLARKREYLREHAEELVPVELDIRRMTTFLPPLGGVVNPTTNQVSAQFMEQLDENLRRGKPEQTEQLGVLRAKVMYFSLGIQQLVQEVVSKFKTQLLLKPQTEGGVPFLQNACCLEPADGSTTLQFFVRQRPGIQECNADAAKTQAVIDRVMQLGQAPTLYDPNPTKPAFPPLSPQFDERTIYMAFAAFCNYNNPRPIPPQLQLFCLNKPDIDASDSVTAQMEKLKRSGVNFTREAFAQMMQVVGAKNVVPIRLNEPEWSNDQQLRDMIAELRAKDDGAGIIPTELQAHILALMDTYDLALSEETPEMRDFKSYLSNLCDDRWARIGAFLDSNRAGVPNFAKQRAKLSATFGALMDFAPQKRGAVIESEDATLARAIQFTKNCMHSLADVFPAMICNQVARDAASVKVPAHWGLSGRHGDDVRNIISRTYAGLNKFYGDRQLTPLLKAMQPRVRDLMRLMSITPFFAGVQMQSNDTPQTSNKTTTVSAFDNRIVHLLYKYYAMELLAECTRMVDYNGIMIEESVPVEEDELVAATLRAEEAATGVMEEVQILQIERTVVGKTIVELLFAYADIVDDERAATDMNADTIKERVRRTKDKEKEIIVEGFDVMTKEQRETEKFFKDHRIGDWNVGMQKGLRQYVKDTYDREREEMEQQLRKERQLSRRDFVSDMQREIFLDGDAEREAAQIEAEEYSLRALPTDDDYGEADDGGALDYEDVNPE